LLQASNFVAIFSSFKRLQIDGPFVVTRNKRINTSQIKSEDSIAVSRN
jgi:hypothetical protein